MSSFFDEIVKDADAMEQKLLGPDYPYYKYIKTPKELGMSAEGGFDTTQADIEGIIAYVQMMIEGKGDASTVSSSQPLGDKFFLKTGAQCKDNQTGKLVDRYIYINNVPDGSIPFLTGATGIQFTDFEGLIPGIMEDLGAMNPLAIFKGFMEGSNPSCTEVTLPTIGQPPSTDPNTAGSFTGHITDDDIKAMHPCDFGSSGRPASLLGDGGAPCQDAFVGSHAGAATPQTSYHNIYILLCSLLLLFIVRKLWKKELK